MTQRTPPDPHDGLVHALIATEITDQGTRIVRGACGRELRQQRWDPLVGASGFQSRVTCEECQLTTRRRRP